MRATRFTAAVAVVTLLIGGCNGDDEPVVEDEATPPPAEEEPAPTPAEEATEPATLTVTAVDDGAGGGYAFELPGTVEAGATRIQLDNTGAEVHHAILFRLNPDATMDDLGAQLATGDPAALLEVGVFDGGTGSVDPGTTSAAHGVADLAEGTYAFLCFIENAEGVPHVAGGMVAPLEVTAAQEPAPLPEPEGEVGLVNYAFQLPEAVAGDARLQVRNASENEPHELEVLRLAPGATFEDFMGRLQAEEPPAEPPPYSHVGGVGAVMPGGASGLALDLDPGDYVFVCYVPSFDPQNEGQPHAALGMVEQVTIE